MRTIRARYKENVPLKVITLRIPQVMWDEFEANIRGADKFIPSSASDSLKAAFAVEIVNGEFSDLREEEARKASRKKRK